MPALNPRAGHDARRDSLSPGLADLGYGALAVGVPLDNVEGADSAGAVNVLYGSDAGLSAAGNQVWHQESAGIRGIAEEGDEFGAALAIIERPTTDRAYLPLLLRQHG